MLQEIEPKQYHVEYTPHAPLAQSVCFAFQGRKLLEREEAGRLIPPTYQELEPYVETVRYLFRIDREAYYLAELREGEAPEGFLWRDIRQERERREKALHFAGTTAYHLSLWYRDNRFCGRCGGETREDQRERMLRYPRCGNLVYPKIAPAVIVALTDGDRLLMTRYQGRTRAMPSSRVSARWGRPPRIRSAGRSGRKWAWRWRRSAITPASLGGRTPTFSWVTSPA